jgi:hypothetical protein
LSFEANRGQTDAHVKFLSRGQGYTLFLTESEGVLSLNEPAALSNQAAAKNAKLETGSSNGELGKPSLLRLRLVGANRDAKAVGLDQLPGRSNYFFGNDRAMWRTDVPHFARVKYEGVYPGIDLLYYGEQSSARSQKSETRSGALSGDRAELEFDFVVAPGADPRAIRFAIETGSWKLETGEGKKEYRESDLGKDVFRPSSESRVAGPEAVRIAANGDLVIDTQGSEVRFCKPVVYQEEWAVGTAQSAAERDDGQRGKNLRRYVDGAYVLRGAAGNHESQFAGQTHEVAFELGPYDRSRPLIIDPVLSYSTFLGGTLADNGFGIAVDGSGNIYVAGTTVSVNFPTKTPFQSVSGGNYDVFVTKLDPTGSTLVYSSYLGGPGLDRVAGMALDSSGSVYLAGTTASANFPTTTGAFKTAIGGGTCGTAPCSDAFIAKIKADGSGLAYSTYLGGSNADSANGVALDGGGSAYVTGTTASTNFPTAAALQPTYGGSTDAFVAKVKPDGTGLVYSTFLGGASGDWGQAIQVDSTGSAFVAGYTVSTNFPTANPLQNANHGMADGFLSKLSAAGDALVYSTYLGGSEMDRAFALALDAAGHAYVGGHTYSSDFPVTAGAYQPALASGICGTGSCNDGFIAKLDPTGSSTLFSTYLGGTDVDEVTAVAVNSGEQVFATGYTRSNDFPLVQPLQAAFGGETCGTSPCPDAFITQLDAAGDLLTHSTYLGGNDSDYGQALFVDAADNVFVTGTTGSGNFPASVGAIQALRGAESPVGDAFVVKVGPAPAPALALSPQKLTYADQPVAFASQPQVIMLINAGSSALTVAGIATSGDFAQTNTCEPSVAGGSATCTIHVMFTPTATGDRAGELSITSDAAGSPHKVPLSGKGIEAKPAITFSPTKVEFPDQTFDTTSDVITATLTNSGYADLTISKIEITGDFAQTNNCPITPDKLALAASCMADITFTPKGSGARSGSLIFTSDASNGASGKNSLALTGEGISLFTLSAETTSVTLDRGADSTTFKVSAAGPAEFTNAITLSCENSSQGSCSYNPATIKVGETSTLTISNLKQVTHGTLNFQAKGVTGGQSATTDLSIVFADFTMTPKPTFATISSGDSIVVKVTLTSTNGFDGTASFACSGLPAESTCTFDPTSLTLDGANPATVNVTIKTTTRVTTHVPPQRRFPWIPWTTGGVALLGLALFAGARYRRVRWALLVGALMALLFVASCNDYYYYEYTGTLPGTYNVVISATVGQASHTTSFSLTVL